MYGASGGEAIDIALKSARHATKRRRLICLERCYHGHTGLAVKVGDDRFSKLFLSEAGPDEVTKVPFRDLDAMEREIMKADAACVIIESIPATYGFPMPPAGYLAAIKRMCEKTGTLFIADEVQTGLMRSGEMWCIETYGVAPDMIVCGKGLSGGIYPISAVVANERSAAWLKEDGWGHMSTFGGAEELGCIAGHKVLEICAAPETRSQVHYISHYLRSGLNHIQSSYSRLFRWHSPARHHHGSRVRSPGRGQTRHALAVPQRRVGDLFALDPRALQFKPGILADRELCDENLEPARHGCGPGSSRGVSARAPAATWRPAGPYGPCARGESGLTHQSMADFLRGFPMRSSSTCLKRASPTQPLGLCYQLPPHPTIKLWNLSENATFRIEDAGSGRKWALRVHREGYHSKNAVASELVWP